MKKQAAKNVAKKTVDAAGTDGAALGTELVTISNTALRLAHESNLIEAEKVDLNSVIAVVMDDIDLELRADVKRLAAQAEEASNSQSLLNKEYRQLVAARLSSLAEDVLFAAAPLYALAGVENVLCDVQFDCGPPTKSQSACDFEVRTRLFSGKHKEKVNYYSNAMEERLTHPFEITTKGNSQILLEKSKLDQLCGDYEKAVELHQAAIKELAVRREQLARPELVERKVRANVARSSMSRSSLGNELMLKAAAGIRNMLGLKAVPESLDLD